MMRRLPTFKDMMLLVERQIALFGNIYVQIHINASDNNKSLTIHAIYIKLLIY